MIKVEIDPGAGFCFGVDQVIQTAENQLKKGETLYGLGEMVHNSREVKRLKELGLQTIDHDDLPRLKGQKVLFRAHGEPPSTFRIAEENQLEVLDGTCPIVSRLQLRIRQTFQDMDPGKEQIVIYGKSHHPETIGLLGQVKGRAVVVNTVDEIQVVNPDKAVHLFSQTTMDPDRFDELEKALRKHVKASVNRSFHSHCTICGQMKKRKPGLARFTQSHDVLIFVSGKNSSNGKMLYEFCRSLNPRSHWISEKSELEPAWLENASSIGISGATSTSREQLEDILIKVKNLIPS